jgi:hypothetical protein
LLDFIDATIDRFGRVEVAYADGCISQACIQAGPTDFTKNDYAKKATIARQSAGLGLYAAYDPKPFIEQNVNSLIALQITNQGTTAGVTSYNLAIKDTSTQTIYTPLRLEVGQISSASGRVTVANADNGQTGAGANWSYNSLVGADNVLSPAEVSGLRQLKFRNPNNESFTINFNVIGNITYTGPSCCSANGGASSGGGGGSSAPSIQSATNLVLQATYNPLLNSITIKVVSP